MVYRVEWRVHSVWGGVESAWCIGWSGECIVYGVEWRVHGV